MASSPQHDFQTRAVRSGQSRTAEGEHNDPMFLTSSFVFSSAREAAERFADREPGNVYTRFTNPTVRTFEERLSSLEGGHRTFATSSGMAAITTAFLVLLKPGDHIVAGRSLFGSTVSLMTRILPRFDIDVTFVDPSTPDAWRSAVTDRTRMLFLETPTNPLGEVADMAALARIASETDALFVVDNCFLTPALQKPFDFGADIVIHSATKYLDGQGRCIGGAVVLADDRFESDFYNFVRTTGPSMSPFNAWVFLNGLETLALRVKAHSDSGLEFARWLKTRPEVRAVHYAGLEDHPHHALAARQQRAYGGIVSFEVDGGRQAAWQVIDALEVVSITANFGDAKSTVTHPATTTHGRLTEAERTQMGVSDSLIRVSVGLEAIADIIADFSLAFDGLVANRVRATA